MGLRASHGKTLAVFFTTFAVMFLILHNLPVPWLNEATASGSASLLWLMGWNASSAGDTVYVNGVPEAVIIPACTGVDSVSLLAAVALADPFLCRRRKTVLLISGIPVLMLFNFFRVALTIISPSWFPAHFVLWMVSAAIVFGLWALFSASS